MSWQTYVDTNLVGTKLVKQAAILGQQGGVWAKSADFNLSQAEQTAAIQAFDNPNITETGVVFAGQKYFIIRNDGRSIYGKKGADGCILVKTKQAILVAIYTAPVQAPEATVVVEGFADYLISVGY